MLRAALLISGKDLAIFKARKFNLIQAVMLGLLLIFIFSLTRGIAETISLQAACAMFWMSSLFCMVLVFNALYALEETDGQKTALLLAPVPIQAVWLGKAFAGFALLTLTQIFLALATLIFLNSFIFENGLLSIAALLLTNMGMCALGSALGSLGTGTTTQESILCVLLFPVLLPLILAAISLFAPAYETSNQSWLLIMLAFNLIYIAMALLLFKFIYRAD